MTAARALVVRLDPPLQRALGAAARRQKRSKSDVAREAIRRYLESDALAAEARKQSLRVSRGRAEADALDFIEHATDVDKVFSAPRGNIGGRIGELDASTMLEVDEALRVWLQL